MTPKTPCYAALMPPTRCTALRKGLLHPTKTPGQFVRSVDVENELAPLTEKTAEACKDLVRGYLDLEGVAARRSIKKAMKEWLFDLRHTRSARIWERDMKRETAARPNAQNRLTAGDGEDDEEGQGGDGR